MKSIVVTPTFNEKENIEEFIREILAVDQGIHVLIVDDCSPDGTGKIVKSLSCESSRVHLIEREGPRGRGFADRLGMQYAINQGFDCIFQMDADFSHLPEFIPKFLEAIKSYDVIIGSRIISGGSIEGRDGYRNVITKLANGYIRAVLGLKPRDCTSGFRCYRREVLSAIDLDRMFSPGPSLLEEILYSCSKKGFSIHEIPIRFVDRRGGESKLGIFDLLHILFLILKIRCKNI